MDVLAFVAVAAGSSLAVVLVRSPPTLRWGVLSLVVDAGFVASAI